MLPLIIPSDDIGTSIVPDHDVPEAPHLDESVELSTTMDNLGNKLDWKSTVSATVKLLCGVRDGLLKSVAQDLCCILENCEV